MLADRPDMVGILSDDDPILLWIIGGMNGDRIGQRIYWNADSPNNGAPADHLLPYGDYPAHIRLSGGTEVTGVDKWAGLVFELFNLENSKQFTEVYSEAMAGKLDAESYARKCANLEYVALKKTRKFFEQHPMPNVKPDHDRGYDQLRSAPATFEEYLAKYTDSDGTLYHPGVYFKHYYDDVIAPYLKNKFEAGE